MKQRGSGLPEQNPPPLATFSPRKQLPGTATPLRRFPATEDACPNSPTRTCSASRFAARHDRSLRRRRPTHQLGSSSPPGRSSALYPHPQRGAIVPPFQAAATRPPRNRGAAPALGGPCSGCPNTPTALTGLTLPPTARSRCSTSLLQPALCSAFSEGKIHSSSPGVLGKHSRNRKAEVRRAGVSSAPRALPGSSCQERWLRKTPAISKIKSEQSL